jgi:hypothetical protein
VTLKQVARELASRLTKIFLPDKSGRRPCHGDVRLFADDPHWRPYPLFYEYFHGETGRGCGASHQTGWTALVAAFLKDVACPEQMEHNALLTAGVETAAAP